MRTSELTGVALDWAVAKCEGTLGMRPSRCFDCRYHEERAGRDEAIYYCHHPKSEHDTDIGWGDAISPDYGVHPQCPITNLTPERYSSNWSQGGPIIEREKLILGYIGELWECRYFDEGKFRNCEYGPTPLIAAMRCYAASKLGGEVDVPNELIKE